MDMKKGMAIIEVNDTETRGFFVDQDALECARLNALTKKRLAQAEAAKREAARTLRNAEKAVARRRAYAAKTFGFVLTRGGIIWAVMAAGIAGMIHPAIYIPVSLLCLCAACLRLGAWFGRTVK